MSEINFFAKTNFRNQERIFGIKEDDRRRHMYVIGKTGMGKSNMLENMAVQDIRNGKGLCVVDPHGEFAEKMLRAVPPERINDVVYFNPADREFPIAFNILEAVDEDKKNLVASGMMGVFKKIWPDVWSPRMEYILNNTILALLDYPGSTMLGVNRMMFDKDYRKRVYPKIKDPVVKSFWINEFDKWEDRFRKEAVAAIQNKVGQFLSSSVIRHIVGQPKSSIDMREIMDNQKILIVNLSKGRIGEDAMRLLGGMIVTKIQLGAMGRVDMPEEERKDFFLYVDEFQNFATESFANILSEARKYRLSLILAHQYIKQLIFDNNTTVKDAVFGNVGTIVSFRVGAEDAEALEKEFEPVFMMNDIVNLSKYSVYLKLMIDGIAGDAFSAITLPPADLTDTADNEEKVIKVSRERYGKSRAEIEEKIARWSGMMEMEDYEKLPKIKKEPAKNLNNYSESSKVKPAMIPKKEPEKVNSLISSGSQKTTLPSQVSREEKNKPEEKSLFEAVCDTCEEKIMVPFKPDPARPTFCKECLKDYQRARARSQGPSSKKEESRNDNFQSENQRREERPAYQPTAFVPKEKPISLNQISHIAPKKFKMQKKRGNINLEEIRGLINNTKNNANHQ
ncbi:MAG TPA: type IV secretion system DNA-binding domain-containing protein [Candidatus Moranbacteria bacterium]|nr:type IV secretion system DNA-binding domain-containing protein [Candidatus Moranbacteria bacterium]